MGENEYRAMLADFRRELRDYASDLLEKLYKGEMVIKELENILLKRGTMYKINGVEKKAFIYFFALNLVYEPNQISHYQNEEGNMQILFEDDLFFNELSFYIEKSYRVIVVSDRLKHSDGLLIDVGNIFISIFCYYYRKMRSPIFALYKAEEILGNPEFLTIPYNAEYDVVEYLFREEMGINK